jgi:hypothetical protein
MELEFYVALGGWLLTSALLLWELDRTHRSYEARERWLREKAWSREWAETCRRCDAESDLLSERNLAAMRQVDAEIDRRHFYRVLGVKP